MRAWCQWLLAALRWSHCQHSCHTAPPAEARLCILPGKHPPHKPVGLKRGHGPPSRLPCHSHNCGCDAAAKLRSIQQPLQEVLCSNCRSRGIEAQGQGQGQGGSMLNKRCAFECILAAGQLQLGCAPESGLAVSSTRLMIVALYCRQERGGAPVNQEGRLPVPAVQASTQQQLCGGSWAHPFGRPPLPLAGLSTHCDTWHPLTHSEETNASSR